MVTLPAPLSTAKSNVMAPLISTGTTNIPESSFNGTSTTESDFLFTADDIAGVVAATFGELTSDAAAFIAGAGSKISTVPFAQWVAASSTAILRDKVAGCVRVGNPSLRNPIIVSSKSQIGVERFLWSGFFFLLCDQQKRPLKTNLCSLT